VTSCTPERVTAARQRMSYRCHVQRRTCHRASGGRWDTKIQLGLRPDGCPPMGGRRAATTVVSPGATPCSG
jgi:hypothetical protein